MAQSKVRRAWSIDGSVSRRIETIAESRGISSSAVAEILLKEALERREAEAFRVREALAQAGLGTATLTLLLTFAILLG